MKIITSISATRTDLPVDGIRGFPLGSLAGLYLFGGTDATSSIRNWAPSEEHDGDGRWWRRANDDADLMSGGGIDFSTPPDAAVPHRNRVRQQERAAPKYGRLLNLSPTAGRFDGGSIALPDVDRVAPPRRSIGNIAQQKWASISWKWATPQLGGVGPTIIGVAHLSPRPQSSTSNLPVKFPC